MSALTKPCMCCVAFALHLLAIQPAFAERPLLGANLGQWLTKTAAPQLAQTLSEHPKFKGQNFKFVTLNEGQVASAHNKLTQTIAQELRHHILRSGNNNIASSISPGRCAQPEPQGYLIGLQVSELGRNHYKFTLGVIDARDDLWVSGVSLIWEGRLLTSERKALRQRTKAASPGSIDNPIHITAADQIARILVDQMRCRTNGFGGEEFYVVHSTQPQLQVLDQALLDALAITPTPLADSKEAATALLSIEVAKGPAGVSKLKLIMHSRGLTQHLGELFASESADPTSAISQVWNDFTGAPQALIATVERISSRRCTRSCVELSVQLNETAYLTLFQTHAGKLTPLSCDQPVKKRSSEALRFRVHLSRTAYQSRPHTGVYVIATRDAAVAEQLNAHLKRTPVACISGHDARQWRQRLIAITGNTDALEWRTVHFTPENSQDI